MPEIRMTKLRARFMRSPDPQFVIAGICGIHPSRLSEYALGRRPIKNAHLQLLCEYFNCNAEDLIGFLDEDEEIDFQKVGVFE